MKQQKHYLIPDINEKVGKTFGIQLIENASTGYIWVLSHMPPGICLLDIVHKPIQPIMPGSDSTKNFYFGAVAACQGYIKFDLIPPGKLLQPEKSITYTIITTDRLY